MEDLSGTSDEEWTDAETPAPTLGGDESSDGKVQHSSAAVAEQRVVWTGAWSRVPVLVLSAAPVLRLSRPLTRPLPGPFQMSFSIHSSNNCEYKVLRSILHAHGFSEVPVSGSNFNLLWTGNLYMSVPVLRHLRPHQKINHFPRSNELTCKDKLSHNVKRMQKKHGTRHFDIIPVTFAIPEELAHFQATFRRLNGVWIVKPKALSRGRGIFLINSVNKLPRDVPSVVSQYIMNPLCVDGFKFDLRLYVAVTSYSPLRIYLYREGLARFATVRYSRGGAELSNLCMHLTNYSINKKSGAYVRCEDPDVEDFGNKWSMSALLRRLRDMGLDTTELMMRIEDIVIRAIISGEASIRAGCKVQQPHRGNCFELYGFDILVDDCLRPWLLEINLSPSTACDAPLDLKIKSNLLADLLTLAGIVVKDSHTGDTCSPKQVPTSQPGTCTRTKSWRLAGGKRSSEMAAIVRETREENDRRGGFLRILPSEDSWELYGAFLDDEGSLNKMLHSSLYSSRVQRVGSCRLSSVIAQRLKHRPSEESTAEPPQSAVSGATRELSAVERAAVYLHQLPNTSSPSSSSDPLPTKSGAGAIPTPGSTSHMISNAVKLSKFQARKILVTYLECVRQRLLKETKSGTVVNDQMNVDMVLKFLKKASASLCNPFTVTDLSQTMSLSNRQRLLAKQLGDFVTAYQSETAQLQTSACAPSPASDCSSCISPVEVESFLRVATEDDLERLLSVYAQQTKLSPMFLEAATARSLLDKPDTAAASLAQPEGDKRGNSAAKANGLVPVSIPNQHLMRNVASSPSVNKACKTPYNDVTNVKGSPLPLFPHHSRDSTLAASDVCGLRYNATKYSEELLVSSRLPTTQQRQLQLLTESLADRNPNDHAEQSEGPKQLRRHRRSLSLKLPTSAASDSASTKTEKTTNKATHHYATPQETNTMSRVIQPALSEESIVVALRRLTLRQNARKYSAPNLSRAGRPVVGRPLENALALPCKFSHSDCNALTNVHVQMYHTTGDGQLGGHQEPASTSSLPQEAFVHKTPSFHSRSLPRCRHGQTEGAVATASACSQSPCEQQFHLCRFLSRPELQLRVQAHSQALVHHMQKKELQSTLPISCHSHVAL